jgi:hypothetical protein
MKTLISIAVLFSMLFYGVSYAQVVSVDLSKLDSNARNAVIDANKKDAEQPTNPEKVREWVDLGKSVGLAFAECAKQLNVEVNSFIRTPAGMITVALITYKIAGKDLIRIVLGVPLWIVITSLIIWSLLYFHGRERIVGKDGSISYVQKYVWSSKDAKAASAAIHVILWVLTTLILSLIIL